MEPPGRSNNHPSLGSSSRKASITLIRRSQSGLSPRIALPGPSERRDSVNTAFPFKDDRRCSGFPSCSPEIIKRFRTRSVLTTGTVYGTLPAKGGFSTAKGKRAEKSQTPATKSSPAAVNSYPAPPEILRENIPSSAANRQW